MKILQSFDFLSLVKGGGTVDIMYRLSQALVDKGHEVTVCVGNYALDAEYLDKLNVEVQMYHSYINQHGIYLMPELVRLDVRPYDVIHMHCYRSLQNMLIGLMATVHHVPFVVDAHGSTVKLNNRKDMLRKSYDLLVGKKLLKNASKVIAETEIGVDEYTALGVPSNKIAELHPLVTANDFNDLPKKGTFRKKYSIDGKMVLYVGRIHENKGLDTLARAMPGNCTMVVVGQDDGFREELETIKSDIVYSGFLNGDEKLSAMVDADVLVQPSKNEAGARPSLEALLCNTPVIVSKNTGAGKQIEKVGGYLFDGEFELRQAIAYVISNNTRNTVEKAKKYIVDNLSFENNTDQYERLYREIIGDRRSRTDRKPVSR